MKKLNYKYIWSLVIVVFFIITLPKAYRMYLNEGKKELSIMNDQKNSQNSYSSCLIDSFSVDKQPNKQCLDFFRNYLPYVFGNSDNNVYPISFIAEPKELIAVYNTVQGKLGEKEKLPPLSELTHGQVKNE